MRYPAFASPPGARQAFIAVEAAEEMARRLGAATRLVGRPIVWFGHRVNRFRSLMALSAIDECGYRSFGFTNF